MKRWLGSIKLLIKDPFLLCRFCYDKRHSKLYTALHIRTANGSPCSERFEDIRHIIGRLSHTMKATKILISASQRLPHLFDDCKVVRARSPPPSSPPLKERNPGLADVVGRMLSNPAEIDSYRHALQELDYKYKLSPQLQEACIDPNWKPRVHAELILLDLFWTRKLDFVEGDKYIGCSKPACYCCYHYIKFHPGKFEIPSCHNNSWPKWKPPEIYDPANKPLIKSREHILNAMVKDMRTDALTQIMDRRGPNRKPPDSLTEISSVRLENLHLSGFETQFDEPEVDDSSGNEAELGSENEQAKSFSGRTSGTGSESDQQVENEDESDEDENEGGVSLAAP